MQRIRPVHVAACACDRRRPLPCRAVRSFVELARHPGSKGPVVLACGAEARSPVRNQGRFPVVRPLPLRASERVRGLRLVRRQRPERLLPGRVRLQRQMRLARSAGAANLWAEASLLDLASGRPDTDAGLLPGPPGLHVGLFGHRHRHVGRGARPPGGGARAQDPLARVVRRDDGRVPLALVHGGRDPVAAVLLLSHVHRISESRTPQVMLRRPERHGPVHGVLSDIRLSLPRGAAVGRGLRVDDGREQSVQEAPSSLVGHGGPLVKRTHRVAHLQSP